MLTKALPASSFLNLRRHFLTSVNEVFPSQSAMFTSVSASSKVTKLQEKFRNTHTELQECRWYLLTCCLRPGRSHLRASIKDRLRIISAYVRLLRQRLAGRGVSV